MNKDDVIKYIKVLPDDERLSFLDELSVEYRDLDRQIQKRMWASRREGERDELEEQLIKNINTNSLKIEEMYEKVSGHWVYEDLIYRFYHHSFKAFRSQEYTEEMVSLFSSLLNVELNERFMRIVRQGTGKVFDNKVNDYWSEETRPIVDAFLHAKYFLDMLYRYREKEVRSSSLPSGWASILYLYNIR
ncbi:hypothetical protein GE107_21510 [Cohnella sp. CFH 77786]|uniref:hypothetical protein n=1 Tax=Cohnella sp. CFH 77786 TaxID=2662265 RepID=UPI001C60CE40|nr:hypothetical protein [Cohnella sp. CFH 77786]MBW5448628.1 hypothetical protein [Cohnella sp. CFH 77786]